MKQVMQPKTSNNGYARRKAEKEGRSRLDNNKMQSGKYSAGKLDCSGAMCGSKFASYESPSRDRLLYLTTCLIGHQVEVQVKNGSIYTGIFHGINTEDDFGVILKMACLSKDGSVLAQKSGIQSLGMAPLKTLIIPGKDLVQIIAKDLSVGGDSSANQAHPEALHDILVDSFISKSRHIEVERELAPWVPDDDVPQCPELEDIFRGRWDRGWDQFEINESLFGVKSTFDEEFYTTKLERGPQTRDLELKASRIAREIECEETQDLHLAEERGINFHENFDIDEETRFSSVYRVEELDDSGYEEEDDILLNSRNTETFGGTCNSSSWRSTDLSGGKSNDGAQMASSASSADLAKASQPNIAIDLSQSGPYDQAKQLVSETSLKTSSTFDSGSRSQENSVDEHDHNNATMKEKNKQAEDIPSSKSEDSQFSLDFKKDGFVDKGGLSSSAVPPAPASHVSSKNQGKTVTPPNLVDVAASTKLHGHIRSLNSRGRHNSSTPSSSDSVGCVPASSGPGLSPSSSVGSLSSEKSTLNPNAKEFKLNPNAKSFMPSQTFPRPASPVSDSSFYFPANVAGVPHAHGLPMGVGIGPAFGGHQPILFNPQAPQMQPPQAYFPPNGPQVYGQQMLVGHHQRQGLYMPSFQPETTPYKGREY